MIVLHLHINNRSNLGVYFIRFSYCNYIAGMITMNKCIAFEIWGILPFRKFYTTSSPLTHAFHQRQQYGG